MKRAFFFLFLSFLGCCVVSAQSIKWSKSYQDYFDRYKDAAIDQMQRHKIPASITLAQGVLESAAGNSDLARNGNNHFGIKCSGWTGRRVYHDDDALGECFRAYDSVSESYEDHSLFLVNRKHYASLFNLKPTDYKGWAKGLKACGYATDPSYATKLIRIIELYQLYEYDTPKGRGKHMSEQPFSPTTSTSVQSVSAPSMRQVYFFNNNYYVLARRGDTFRSLADEVGVGYKKLARYNERDKDDMLEDGEIIWLEKKQSRAPKEYFGEVHVVSAGESMYTISQRYGIRLKNLYKINQMLPTDYVRVGDQIRLR